MVLPLELNVKVSTCVLTKADTDQKANSVRTEYVAKARTIDRQVAQKLGHPAPVEGVPGPFEKAIRSFVTGGPIPIVAGLFSELNGSFDSLITVASCLSAKSAYGLSIAPDNNEQILRHQFRRSPFRG